MRSLSAVVAFVREVVLTLPSGSMAYVTIPAPVTSAEHVLAQGAAGQPAFLWHTGGSTVDTLVGLGAAALLQPDGDQRLPRLRKQAERLFAGMVTHAAPGTLARTPRIVGALSFVPGGAAIPPWESFGDAVFALPRWTYRCDAQAATLSLALAADGEEPAKRATRAAREAEALLAGLTQQFPVPHDSQPRSSANTTLDEQDQASWTQLIEGIRAAIRAGQFRKVVAARRSTLRLVTPLRDTAVLTRLAREQQEGTRFALRRGAATFLGVTPERLLRKRGTALYTEALAGSLPLTAHPQPERLAAMLQDSAKDREEHDLVVQDLAARLRPLCARLDVPAVPEVRALRRMLHLLTPVCGALRDNVHVLDLLQALHPTPAVGGVPRGDALRWIAAHEATPRGLYAGPVGWFDSAGDGEFMVAIRSGLLTPAAAYLFAGAGITGNSDPRAEYEETSLKQQTMLRALLDTLAEEPTTSGAAGGP